MTRRDCRNTADAATLGATRGARSEGPVEAQRLSGGRATVSANLGGSVATPGCLHVRSVASRPLPPPELAGRLVALQSLDGRAHLVGQRLEGVEVEPEDLSRIVAKDCPHLGGR